MKKCKTCDLEAWSRGLCRACYSSSRRMIKAGETTEDKLIELGLLEPRKCRGRAKNSRFYSKFLDVVEKQKTL